MKYARGHPRRRGRGRLGATATEYMLILALVVLPLAAITPMAVRMIGAYAYRIGWVIRLPFG